jgi:hypothetical protein
VFPKNSNLFLLKNNFFNVLNRFDALILKIIFLKIKKNIILMHFGMKNTLKNNQNKNKKKDVNLC